MCRRSGTRLTGKETSFVKGLAEGRSQAGAARRTGYSEQVATKKAYQMLQRPLVQSAFTDALERAGLTWDQIVKPLKEALEATIHLEDSRRKRLIDTGVPDLKVRQQAHDRAVALYGGIPKTGEAVPAAHGLNLFIAVGTDRPQTSKPDLPRTVVNALDISKTPVPAPRTPPSSHAPSAPTKIRIGITVADPVTNRQGPKPNGEKPNGTG